MKIEKLREISEAATAGPWVKGVNFLVRLIDSESNQVGKDTDFIIQARNHFDALLEVAEKSKDMLEAGNFIHEDSGLWNLEEALEKLEAIE